MKITTALLKAADSTNTHEYYDSILEMMNQYSESYEINTPLRVAHFLSQIGHESKFKIVEENGNYSAKRMREFFGCRGGPRNYNAAQDECTAGRLREKLWTEESKYARNAKNLFSYVYASRLGNGDEASGDGHKYRGRGMMQLTGKTNYSQFTASHNQKNPNDPRDSFENLVGGGVQAALAIGDNFHFLSEFSESADMVTNTLSRIEFIKVVNTKILVGFVIAKHEIDGNQQAVFDRANGAFFSTPPG